jgi:hypothetical protein
LKEARVDVTEEANSRYGGVTHNWSSTAVWKPLKKYSPDKRVATLDTKENTRVRLDGTVTGHVFETYATDHEGTLCEIFSEPFTDQPGHELLIDFEPFPKEKKVQVLWWPPNHIHSEQCGGYSDGHEEVVFPRSAGDQTEYPLSEFTGNTPTLVQRATIEQGAYAEASSGSRTIEFTASVELKRLKPKK